MSEPLIFDLSRSGRGSFYLPDLDVPMRPLGELIPKGLLNPKEPPLPEISEIDLVRHFTKLSRMNFGVDLGFYPLGSCTMKYSPKVNEDIAALPGFAALHPYQDEGSVQGMLELLYNFEQYLCAIFGYDAFTLQPAAGAHGELTSLFMIKAYHLSRGDDKRCKVVVPDSSHGTNPASASMVGYRVVQIRSNDRGGVDLDELRKAVGPDTAALMLTNPNTLGLFDEDIIKVAKIVHEAGGLLYYDGANANANLGYVRPADLGFDIAHFNLHKTFSTPHGGGGPGSGPVGCTKALIPFLPVPYVDEAGGKYLWSEVRSPKTIGKVHSFHGNINVIVRAYSYVRSLGGRGLREVSENAVLNANYCLKRLRAHYYLPYDDRFCQHEFVISAKWQKDKYGIRALDIAKRLIDYGFHPPTIYFPLIVEEAMMIEPTETESKETLDAFCDAMIKIAGEAESDPQIIRTAPHFTPVGRLDETKAAREPDLRWRPK